MIGPYELNRVYNLDCLEGMKKLPDGSVDLVLTDPPFNIGFTYASYADNLAPDQYRGYFKSFSHLASVVIHYPEDMIRNVVPVLGEPHKCVAWVYNANTPRQWRMIAWFGCSPEMGLCRQPYKNPTDKRVSKLIDNGSEGAPLYDWWEVQQVKNVNEDKSEHPCQMPLEVIRRIILTTTRPNDLILDPFAGSGTTGVAAVQLGRRFLGFEIDPEYCQLANDRIEAANKGMKLNEYRAGQLSLF